MTKAPITLPQGASKNAPEITKPANEKRIRDTDYKHGWTIIGLDNCQWSKAAIRLMEEHGENFAYKKIDAMWHRKLSIEFRTKRLPAIFKGSQYFGDFAALENYYKCSFVSDTETL